jgi:hypothetical protein
MPTYTERSHPEYRAEHDAPDTSPSLEQQLMAVAVQIDNHRQIMRPVPSDRAWARAWPALGSAKTWAKIMDGDFSEMSVAAKLPDYRGVLAALAAQMQSHGKEVLYDDLGGAQEVALAALRLMHHTGKDRLILIEGGSGSGKTSSLDLLESGGGVGSVMFRMEADESWKSLRVALKSILSKMGTAEDSIPASTGDRMSLLITVVRRKGRIFLVVDEAHHVTGAILNLFKTLLNQTDLLLIVAGMKTLLQKLRAASSEEAKQLIYNRLFEKITLAGPDADGTRDFFARRLAVPATWSAATCESIAAASVHCGHWSYLRRTLDQLRNSGIHDPNDADLCGAAQKAALEIA